VLSVLLFGAWLTWFTCAPITLHAVSSQARIELASASRPIAAATGGRVVSVRCRLGHWVRQGEVLVELDSTAEQLELREARVRAQGLTARLERLGAELDAERDLVAHQRAEAHLGARQATDLAREAKIAASAAEREAKRLAELSKAGLAPERELEQGAAAAEMRHLAAQRLGTAAEQVPRQQAVRERESWVRLERLRLELATLASERERRSAEVERLEYEVERRRVRAPVSGRVGEVAEIYPGSFIEAGAQLGSVVPSGDYVVVAHYPADVALGRIRSGQSAELRLDGFAWSEFGTVSSTVTHVAQEVRDGAVRVESNVAGHSSFRGKLEHGMPGMLEVTLERVTPFRLVLRTAGAWLTVQR